MFACNSLEANLFVARSKLRAWNTLGHGRSLIKAVVQFFGQARWFDE